MYHPQINMNNTYNLWFTIIATGSLGTRWLCEKALPLHNAGKISAVGFNNHILYLRLKVTYLIQPAASKCYEALSKLQPKL